MFKDAVQYVLRTRALESHAASDTSSFTSFFAKPYHCATLIISFMLEEL
jgi:hypothetical protein